MRTGFFYTLFNGAPCNAIAGQGDALHVHAQTLEQGVLIVDRAAGEASITSFSHSMSPSAATTTFSGH
jgi:hypothetical protein